MPNGQEKGIDQPWTPATAPREGTREVSPMKPGPSDPHKGHGEKSAGPK